MVNRLKLYIKKRLIDAFYSLKELLKIVVPFSILAFFLDKLGFLYYFEILCKPLVVFLDLPTETSLIWASSMIVNMYAGLIIAPVVLASTELSITQATVLGSIILIAHALPVEVSIAKKLHVPVWICLLLRIGGALVYGKILSLVIPIFTSDKGATIILPTAKPAYDLSFFVWFQDQLWLYLILAGIVTVLIFLLDFVRYIKLEAFLFYIFSPLFKSIGISKNASSLLFVGLLLGISYGAGLIFQQVRDKTCARDEAFYSMCFLSICHSVIEDTILMLLLGGSIYGLLIGRIIFAFIILFLLKLILKDSPILTRIIHEPRH